ncbi:MAG: bifunctional nuclease family protein, partial [Flavobacteriales bacterium]|nr:bifunctional nuclease family protein [Flavobacteriales bacterium]
MKKIDLEIFDISLNGGNSGAYVMVLMEKGGNRKIPILIGGFEAQYIAIELENMKPSRPLTHDLFKSTLSSFGMNVTEVVIFDYKEGVFFAKIIVTDGEKVVEVDSRSSDAVAIAVRFRAPIRCYESVIESTGITPEEEAEINREEAELEKEGQDVEDDKEEISKKEDVVKLEGKIDEDIKRKNILE